MLIYQTVIMKQFDQVKQYSLYINYFNFYQEYSLLSISNTIDNYWTFYLTIPNTFEVFNFQRILFFLSD